jgi:hypothetical protein
MRINQKQKKKHNDDASNEDDVYLDKLQTRSVKKIYPLHVKGRLQPIRHK